MAGPSTAFSSVMLPVGLISSINGSKQTIWKPEWKIMHSIPSGEVLITVCATSLQLTHSTSQGFIIKWLQEHLQQRKQTAPKHQVLSGFNNSN